MNMKISLNQQVLVMLLGVCQDKRAGFSEAGYEAAV